MMIAENEIIFCPECKGYIEYCFCSCPYCGNITENCRCNLENLRGIDKILPASYYSKHGLLNKSKKSYVVNIKDDDWWRLEKWQIGRKKIP
ncbi:MAG: hypothetical protein OEM28_12620 [Nitrosopumilus sp.]|nr:hypothetical protein [Nitrosopumilus sp.]MDH3488770.1 hypothetical protein [Nitrosopumilus sp.]